MYILGISCYYHDSAISLIKNGKILWAAEEERFTRKKHDSSFPINSLKACLAENKICADDLSAVCFYEKPALKLKRILAQHASNFPFSLEIFRRSFVSWLTYKFWIEKKIKKELKGYSGKIYFCEHHEAHAASAFFPSQFKEAAFLTIDGVGEWATTTYGVGNKNNIQILGEIHFPNSLGLLYSTITAYLGFSVNNSEYKVMGLAAYGSMNKRRNRYYKIIKSFLNTRIDGSFELNMKYFDFDHALRMPSEEMCKALGGAIRGKNEEVTLRHKDIAAALQMVYEDSLFAMLDFVKKETKMKNIVLAGGCALNSVANGKILKNSKFKGLFIQPNSGDGGGSLGAALYCHHQILGNKKRFVQEHAYLGPEYQNSEIKKFLDSKKINYSVFRTDSELVRKTAELIHQNKVVGWFEGRAEWGPRALGARSILANPCSPKMQDILNEKVKHRELFRPFAPAVCAEDANKYFECDHPLPSAADFMLLVYPIKMKWKPFLPAVTHVDGTGRLQTVRKKHSPLYYRVIKEFGRLSKIPIIINTSFNIRGEPIVLTPQDAYRCMMGTEIDCLIIGNFLIKREDNKKDIFESEVEIAD